LIDSKARLRNKPPLLLSISENGLQAETTGSILVVVSQFKNPSKMDSFGTLTFLGRKSIREGNKNRSIPDADTNILSFQRTVLHQVPSKLIIMGS
jgi:ssRNA-specific RNase YbeY (16S rRNA maturation enzyme)